MDKQELKARFHPITVDGEVAGQMEHLREETHRVADYLDDIADDGREKSTALTHLETALFWANRAIAMTNRDAAG